MTITRIWQSGWELNDADYEITNYVQNHATRTTTLTTDVYAKTGTYSLRCGRNYDSSYYSGRWEPLGSGVYQARAGLWVRPGYAQSNHYVKFLSLWQGATDILGLRLVPFSTAWQVYVNNSLKYTINGFSPYVWYHVGLDLKVDGTNGWAYVYVNGVLKYGWDGNTGTTAIAAFGMGDNPGSGSSGNLLNNDYTYYDDCYLDNSTGESTPAPLDDLRFQYVRAAGNGNYSQWTGVDEDSTDNYLHVDDPAAPDGDTSYVYTPDADDLDSYDLGTYTPTDNSEINAVIPIAGARREGTSGQIAVGTRLSSTDQIGSDNTPSAAYYAYKDRQTTKPGGGSWTATDVNNSEVIIKSRA